WDLERRYHLGKTAWQLGETDEAFLELERVVAQVPTDVRARRILVLIHATRGQSVDLVRELEAVARLDDDDVPTKLDLAAAYVAARREIDAIRTYDAIVARDPKQWQALKFLGDLHARAGRSDAAIGYWSRAISANPRDPRPYFVMGAAYVARGDDVHARRLYIRAQRFAEYLGETWNNLGAISYREGKLQESLWYLRRAVKKSPRSVRIRYNLALSLSASKDMDKALAEIETGLALDSKHVGLTYLRGVALLRKGEAGQAREAFQAVLKLDPDHADARHNLDLLDRMERRASQGSEIIRE
ncbi:MAG TPA: tetratricopeptide repeat protein, partial [Kofleriaceae bacterium]|nr:tetratricopeptide repeat protein [Kofleriaceae bacterium]